MADSNIFRNLFFEWNEEFDNVFKKLDVESEELGRDLKKRTDSLLKSIQKYAKTGKLDDGALNIASNNTNKVLDQENVPANKGKSRSKKPLAESTKENLQEVKIKKEKLSNITGSKAVTRSSVLSTASNISETLVDFIKTEPDMPAPTWIPPKKKTKEIKVERSSVRSTRTKSKKATVRDSDVIVQNATMITINLSDTDESENEKAQQKEQQTTRSTRTKTRRGQAQTQSDSSTDTDTDSKRSTRTKTRNKKEEESTENTEVEETRNTRTKTIRKGKQVETEPDKGEQEEISQGTRSTRTKTSKKEAKAADESLNSNKEETVREPTRSTRTKTRKVAEKNAEEAVTCESRKSNNDVPAVNKQKTAHKRSDQGKMKRNRSGSTDEEANDKKRSKSVSPVQEIEANATTRSVYEDAHCTLVQSQDKKQQLNTTYVADAPFATESHKNAQVSSLNATVTVESAVSNAANSTVVLDKPHFNIFDKKSCNALLTDDDSIEIIKTPPKKAPTVKASKEVFSPYEKTTLKKKVEAFEKLQNGSEIPVKSNSNLRSHNTPSAVKEKAKIFTPLGSKFAPASSSTSKVSRLLNHQHNASSNESLSAMKSAQKEARDRQKRQMEREQALKKKEAMLQAQAEAKKKLNEEKQLKALQQRKVLEAEKQKQLEVQKQKEAKLRQRELEREEYLQKQKLELDKKRLAQKKKYQELQSQREEQTKNTPIYMTTRAPKLPTADCYDSDDPDYHKVTAPSWCVGEYSRTKQITMLTAGEKIKNTLFCRKPLTPDLIEIFEVIDPKKLKRSSSHLWRAPPRYTMMPNLNETTFEEDDELYESD